MKNRSCFLLLAATTVHGISAHEPITLENLAPVFEGRVCIEKGPLSRKDDGCIYVSLPLDDKSATGYKIPDSPAMAFQMLDSALDDTWKQRLRVLHEQGYTPECAVRPECVSDIVGELMDKLGTAWGENICSPLAHDLRQHGVALQKGLMDELVLAYRDIVVAPNTDGPFTRFAKSHQLKPTANAAYPYFVSRGYGFTEETKQKCR